MGELIGQGVTAEAATAVWDVGGRSKWSRLIGQPISHVHLRHAPWEGSEMWLPRLSVHFAADVVEVLLGEGRPDDPEVHPSADNVAVMFNPTGLPAWVKG